MKKHSKEKAFGTYEIARRCHVTPLTVYRWIKEGKLRAFRTGGGRNRVLESDLDEFLQTLDISVQKILIVEDDLAIRRLMTRLIKKSFPKVKIEEATDGYEAGFKTRDIRPHIVILDLLLPCIDGIKVCRILRKSPQLKGIKIMGMTGYKTEKSKRVFLKAGANEFITKPFSQDEFIQKLGRLL